VARAAGKVGKGILEPEQTGGDNSCMSDIAPASSLYGPSGSRIDSSPPSVPSPQARPAGRGAHLDRPDRVNIERPSDKVDISERARLLAKLSALPEIRQDLVQNLRTQIAAGIYETPERLDAAIDQLLDELAQQPGE
jgi:negative regulator of flagellin synthesis FlgM